MPFFYPLSSTFVLTMAVAATAAATTTSHSFQPGDSCGVYSANFTNYDFAGDYAVAGQGCTLGESSSCFCAPDFTDNAALSEWKWQCGNAVVFGPNNKGSNSNAEGDNEAVLEKMCPATVPVPKKNGISETFVESMLGVPQYCDTATHPTGRPGDEVCAYSTCEDDTVEARFSAICGCVDLDARGLSGGMQWFCLHSTCECGGDSSDILTGDELATSGAAAVGAVAVGGAAALAAVGMVSF